jgi:uncharacterized protein (UPF0303 family)
MKGDAYMQDLERCREQEKKLVFSRFSREDAFAIGCRLYEETKKTGKGVAIQIIVNELIVFRVMPEGTTKNSEKWLTRKHNMVIAKGMSSERARLEREHAGKTMEDWCMKQEEFAAAGGGFPIRLKDSDLIGSICLSGLAASDDHALIVKVLEEYLG